jgi:hypothetical protein
MKKLILSILAAGCALSSFAHGGGMKAGDLLLYGVGSYSNNHGSSSEKFGIANTNTFDNPRQLNWRVSPGIGFNVTDFLTIGVEGGYSGSKYNVDRKTIAFTPGIASNDQIKTYDWGVGIFGRTTLPLSRYFFAFGQIGAGYITGRETYRYVTTQTGGVTFVGDNNYNGLQAYYLPGIGAMLTPSLGLTFSLGGVGYEYRKYDISPNNVGLPGSSTPGSNFERKDNNFVVSIGQQFNLGIQKYIGCGHGHRRRNVEPMDDTRQMDTSDDTENNSNNRRRRSNDDE